MTENNQNCSTDTEGLILSSFEVLEDNMAQANNVRQLKLKNTYGNRLEDNIVTRSGHFGQSCLSDENNHSKLSPHPCVTEATDGDEMFDVTDNDQFRGDEAGDSLDNDTNNNSLDRDDEGDDEEEEDDEDEDEVEDDETGDIVRPDQMQNLAVASQDISVSSDVNQSATSPSMSDLRGHHPQQDAYVNHTTSMTAHSFMNTGRTVWHSETNTPNGGSRYSGEWHLPLNAANNGLHREARQQDVFSGSSSPDESRDGASDDQHWKFVHGHPGDEHAHWGEDHGQTKVVVGPGSATWAAPKRELDDDQAHDLQTLHPHGSLERPGHWGQHIRPSQPNLHGWPKEIGNVFTPEPDLNNVRNLFALQPAQTALSAPSVNATYTDLATAGAGTWNLGSHLPAGSGLSALPRPLLRHDMTCHRTGTPGLYHQTPTQGYSAFQGQGREDWQTQALSPGPSGLTAEVPAEHFKISGVQRGQVCKSAILTKRGKGRGARGGLTLSASNTQNPSQVRTTLDQVRQQTHPYQIKEQKKVVRDVYPATSANVHTLKASHIVSWYIDYLIHENEHLTQISRAFSLPVNLFHSDDFYFMDSLKKKVHFPSLKFLSWMQQNLPSINVNAIDFHEGRPPVMSTWNQDWFWQNKSRRDIIHDVFFYFQHRRVTCEN